jgi:serine/threonine protein phosphatase PrpC
MTSIDWRITGASVTGTSHLENDNECQDRLGWKVIETAEGKILAAAISDGAGTTTDGEKGAELACASFLTEIESFLSASDARISSLNADFGVKWISHFQSLVKKIAEDQKKELREFSSTFVGAVVGRERSSFYQVGDGGVLFTSGDGEGDFRFAIVPEETEYVNMTSFLADEDAGDQLMFRSIDVGITDLVMFSDGITNVAVDFSSGKPFEPFLRPMIAPLRNGNPIEGLDKKLESFLASPAINEKTDDDKTIILASRKL